MLKRMGKMRDGFVLGRHAACLQRKWRQSSVLAAPRRPRTSSKACAHRNGSRNGGAAAADGAALELAEHLSAGRRAIGNASDESRSISDGRTGSSTIAPPSMSTQASRSMSEKKSLNPLV